MGLVETPPKDGGESVYEITGSTTYTERFLELTAKVQNNEPPHTILKSPLVVHVIVDLLKINVRRIILDDDRTAQNLRIIYALTFFARFLFYIFI